jgi:hypothetical protein
MDPFWPTDVFLRVRALDEQGEEWHGLVVDAAGSGLAPALAVVAGAIVRARERVSAG